MNTHHPHLRPADDPQGPDYLAGAVLHGLARPVHEKLSWGFLQTMVWGVLSFGLLPILVWRKRFRQYITLEQQQLWHLADWLRLNSKSPQAAILKDQAETMRPHFDLQLLSSLCLGFLAIIFFTQLQGYHRFMWDAVLDCTYLYPMHRLHNAILFHRVGPTLAFKLYNTWILALSGAYVCHWLQVQLHARELRKFIARFNVIAVAEGLSPMPAIMPGWGLRPIWLVGAAILIATGSFWGLPMMLAGAAQRRMVRYASTGNRAAMAHQLRAMMLARRPVETVPMPVYLRSVCENPACRAPVQSTARFCSRCGARIVPALHRMA